MKFREVTSPTENVPGEWYRLRVEWDPEDSNLAEVADERLTSCSSDARALSTPANRSRLICLHPNQVKWLHETLGRLLETQHKTSDS